MVELNQTHDTFLSDKYFLENDYDDKITLKTNKFQKIDELNKNLTRLQKEVVYALRYRNEIKLVDLGVKDQLDLNFMIEVEPEVFFSPLVFCVAAGFLEGLQIMIHNVTLDLHLTDSQTGCNAFWFGAFYNRLACMKFLAARGIDIYNKHKVSGANALHIAVQKKHYGIVEMLVQSGYELNHLMKDGISALQIASSDLSSFGII